MPRREKRRMKRIKVKIDSKIIINELDDKERIKKYVKNKPRNDDTIKYNLNDEKNEKETDKNQDKDYSGKLNIDSLIIYQKMVEDETEDKSIFNSSLFPWESVVEGNERNQDLDDETSNQQKENNMFNNQNISFTLNQQDEWTNNYFQDNFMT